MSKRHRNLTEDKAAKMIKIVSTSESEISNSESDFNITSDDNFSGKSDNDPESDKEDIDQPNSGPFGQSTWIWSSKINHPVTPLPFRGFSGLKMNQLFSSELDAFRVFFDNEITHIITTETNSYMQVKKDSGSSSELFEPVTEQEIFVFLALTILMSIVKKPNIKMYFSTEPVIETPIFNQTMKYDRYLEILQNLHFSSYSPTKLDKINLILDKVRKNFKSVYIPEKDIYIDENLLLLKEHTSFCQYIPSRRSHQDIILYKMCESASGYIWNFIMPTDGNAQREKKDSFREKVVKTLLEDRIGNGHNLYLNQFFISPELANEMFNLGVNVCGVVDKNRRNMPQNFPSQSLKPGSTECMQYSNINVIAFRDQFDTLILTTIHDNNLDDTGKIDKKTKKPILKPRALIDYNSNMEGIDFNDSVITHYPAFRKSNKWYQKLFFNLLDMCIFNANVVYNKKHITKMSPMNFRLNIVSQILAEFALENSPPVLHSEMPSNLPRLTGRHFPSLYKRNPASRGKSSRRRCVVCSKKSLRKTSYFECKICGVGLCPDDCFEIYHTQEDFYE